ncbi:unnamed protein product [Mytilus coruscus]|uniref:DZIP3-like HEPN domain-containing protein n=1 Tax=Mytilus coruscus TaxID=42192 RepID=A0A6J8BDY0_MYTCO|nr:unnamed protein product [Mytilus coruscus]CAC5381105.1 unnamed protein product [Mytilus coruscus]CAC5381106.1 unnamed protein product [Mytilus coruscus]
MSSIQERHFYLQLLKFTIGPAINAIKHFFEVKILNNSSFEAFLNDQSNMHILFHQCFSRPCCKCVRGSLASPTKRGCLNQIHFEMLYDYSDLQQPNHEHVSGKSDNKYCLCKYSAKCSVKVCVLDISMLDVIIQNCCPSKINQTNAMWLQSIKDIRNQLVHVGEYRVKKAEYEDHWKTLKTATLGFAGEIGDVCEEMFQHEISRIQNVSIENLEEILDKSNDNLIKLIIDMNESKPLERILQENHKLLYELTEQTRRLDYKTKSVFHDMHAITSDIGKIKHKLNHFDSIIKEAVVRAIEEEKGKKTSNVPSEIAVADVSMETPNLKMEITDEENDGLRQATPSTLSTNGKINEGYVAGTTERDKSIGDLDENERGNSSNKQQERSSSMDTEDPESKRKVFKQEFGKRIHAWSRSSSLSQLHLSILEDNDIEKDWFYKLNITCDNYSLHLINDSNIQRKFKALSKTVQSKSQTKLTTEYNSNEISTTAFERIYQHIICSNVLPMSDCIRQNLDLAVRFLLARNIAPTELSDCLHESMKEKRNAISKAVGWTIAKQFYKDILQTKVAHSFIDIWPGYRCRCEKHRGKGHFRICSTEPVIVVEVDLFSNAIPHAFYGIPVQQSYQVVEGEHGKVQCHDENTDVSTLMDAMIQTPVSISGEIAEILFKQHSKMTMIHVHPLRRKNIQLWGQIKGVIPMGEAHFPKMVNGKDTCIAEGHVKFMAKIKIGDTIGFTGSTGTLGGFVQMHGYNAFLTCAHVVHNKETLFSGNKRERHKSKTNVFCVDTLNPNSSVECGYVLNEVFDFNDAKETSVDAAVVVLNEENVKIDEDDILNKSPSGPVKADFLGMQGPYLNDNYITPKALRGTVKAKCVGMTSGYSDNDVTFEDYDKDDDQFKNKQHGLSLYFKHIEDRVEDIKRECLGSLAIPYEVHFQHLVVQRLDEEIQKGRLYFRFFNQLLLENFVFKQGDSGTCIYVVEDKTNARSDNQPNPKGCLAMAIASFYDSNERRNKCIATPMKAILKKLGLI